MHKQTTVEGMISIFEILYLNLPPEWGHSHSAQEHVERNKQQGGTRF